MFPRKYQSDFAVQVTSQVDGAQQHTINFTNNNLLGSANFLPAYNTRRHSRSRAVLRIDQGTAPGPVIPHAYCSSLCRKVPPRAKNNTNS